MQGYVYDIERGGKSCEFVTTTDFLKGYVYRTYENAKLLEGILTDFVETPLKEPDDPDDDQRKIFKLQLEIKDYYKDKANLK